MLRKRFTFKLPILSTFEIERVLCKIGFKLISKRGKGSHKIFIKSRQHTKKKLVVTVPQKKDIPRRTLLSIIKQAGLTKEEFMCLLKEF